MIKNINSAFLADPMQSNERKIYQGKLGPIKVLFTLGANVFSLPTQFVAGSLGFVGGVIGGSCSTLKNWSIKKGFSTGCSYAAKTAKVTAILASAILFPLTIASYACSRLAGSQSAWARSLFILALLIQKTNKKTEEFENINKAFAEELNPIYKRLIPYQELRFMNENQKKDFKEIIKKALEFVKKYQHASLDDENKKQFTWSFYKTLVIIMNRWPGPIEELEEELGL